MYMVFANKGEIPVNAFKLLGASNKRDDESKIGFFGTGLKYALAVLLREEVDFRVFSGLNEVKIGTRRTKFLDKPIKVITVNGEKTSITVEAGIDWDGWFAVREIYANTLDEGGTIGLEEIKPEAGSTKIYIEADSGKLGDVFKHWQKYFASERPAVFVSPHYPVGRILEKLPSVAEFHVYRKGILTYDSRSRSLFDYDVDDLDINDSRRAKNTWEVMMRCSSLLAKAPADIVAQVTKLIADKDREDYIEWDAEFWGNVGTFSKSWLEVIGDKELVPYENAGAFELSNIHMILPDRLIKKLRAYFGKLVRIAGEEVDYLVLPDQSGVEKVKESMARLAKLGYKSAADIKIVQFKDNQILGSIDDGKILISNKAIDRAQSHLDKVVLEELLHLSSGMDDRTRAFQSYLIEEILYLAERLKVDK